MTAIRVRDRFCTLIFLLMCLSHSAFAQDAASNQPVVKSKPVFVPKITIGKETTWVTEPVGPNGFIDYLAAVNHRHSQGVTLQNNAVVLLYRAMGPNPDRTRQPDRFFQLLGIEPPPEEGTYYEGLGNWWRRKEKPLPEGAVDLNAISDMESTAQSRPWKAKEFPEIAEWLRDLDVPLQFAAEAASRTEYFSPVVPPQGKDEGKMIEVLLPGAQLARGFARAFITRAMLRLGEGDDYAALRDLFVLHRLGRLVGRGPTMIEGLVGIALESMAIEAELRMISETQPSARFVARYRKQLDNLPTRSLMADKIDVAERAMFLDCCIHIARGNMHIEEIAGGDADNSFLKKLVEGAVVQSVEWDEVLKTSNRWYDRMVTAVKLPTYREREASLAKLDEDIQALAKKRQGPTALLQLLGGSPAITQAVAETLITLLLPAVRQAHRAEDKIVQRMQNLDVALALSAWRSEHDSYPKSLADLVPKYLAVVPIDRFNGEPLHYSTTPDGYLFYSVGQNGKDDEGRSFDDNPRGDDLPVQMPKPQLK